MVDARASWSRVASGQQDTAVAQHCCSGEAEAVQNVASHKLKPALLWIVDLRPLCATAHENAAILERNHGTGQLEPPFIQFGTWHKPASGRIVNFSCVLALPPGAATLAARDQHPAV